MEQKASSMQYGGKAKARKTTSVMKIGVARALSAIRSSRSRHELHFVLSLPAVVPAHLVPVPTT